MKTHCLLGRQRLPVSRRMPSIFQSNAQISLSIPMDCYVVVDNDLIKNQTLLETKAISPIWIACSTKESPLMPISAIGIPLM